MKTVSLHLNTFRHEPYGPVLAAILENGITPLAATATPELTEQRLTLFTAQYKARGYTVEVIRWVSPTVKQCYCGAGVPCTCRTLASDLAGEK